MNSVRAAEIVSHFSKQHVLVIGDVMLDRYVLGKVERLNPEAPVPILHAHREIHRTGGAGNTAKNAAMLGATTTLISVVGADQGASTIANAAQSENYTTRLITDPSRPSIEKNRYLVNSQQLLRVDYEETHDVSAEVEEGIILAIKETLPHAAAVLVSDYAKGVVTPNVAKAIMHSIRQYSLPVMADVKPSRASYFTGATYLSPNRKEAHEFLGLNQFEHGGHSKEELAARLVATFNSTVFLTLSDDGMYVQSPDTTGSHVPQLYTKEDDVVDTSGCGDTAAVTILLAKLSGATDVEAAELGNAAGAVVAHKIGSVGLTADELLAMINRHHE